MRVRLYEILGVVFLVGSGYFFYRTVEFLARADYVAGLLAMVVGFLVIRAGVDLSRLAVSESTERK